MNKRHSALWKPSCSLDSLKARAELYSQLRAFFLERDVLEVETPILGRSTATDPHLDSLFLNLVSEPGAGGETLYLHTSPEFPMKRLLASGSGAIFQITKTFRNAESGSRHNPEFSMLEWYRPGFSLTDLMQETSDLLRVLIGECQFKSTSYRNLFKAYLNIDPMAASLDTLQQIAIEKAGYMGSELTKDEYLDLLISICIEPHLGQAAEGTSSPLFVYDYPASQASLAAVKQDEDGYLVAERFELYINGLEIANAYHELTDAAEQRKRFEADNKERQNMGCEQIPLDESLLSALESGMPDCSGVALGLDRLLMVKTGAKDISEVISFPLERV